MADEQQPADATKPTDYAAITDQVMRAIAANLPQGQMAQWLSGVKIESDYNAIATALKMASEIAVKFADAIASAEADSDPAFGRLAASAVNDLFGVNVNSSAFAGRGKRGAREGEMDKVSRALLSVFNGGQSKIVPSDEPAQKFMGTMLSFSIEGWLEGWIFEMISAACPLLGEIETFAELDDILANVFGFGRLTRRVLSPLIDATIVTPMEWKVNLTHRHKLLAAGDVARQVARGRWSRERGIDELARQGYDDERIEALFNSVAKFHTAADLDLMIRAGLRAEPDAVQHLRDQGYGPDVAAAEIQLEQLKRIASFERSMAGAAVDAYVAGRISEGELGGFATGATIDAQEKAQYVELASARRILAARPLSSGEAEACVKAGILSYRDYRDALRRENRTEDAVTALELLLRFEVDKQKKIEQHRDDVAAERAAEKQARLDAAAAKKAEQEAARALDRRGRRADLERAAVLGLVPFSRVAELYAATYDPDTAATLLELLEIDRQAYLTGQAARKAAADRGAVRGVDAGALERAVVAGVLTLAEFRARLQQLGFPPADVAILASTLEAKIADTAAAKEQREQAAAAARGKKVSLGTVETLVRRGHRSMAEYDALLVALGFDDAARAYMRELLQVQIDDDARARAEREAAENTLKPRGLSLEQVRRGVLLGLTTIDAFQTFLVNERFTPDAVQLLTAELRADVAEAEAARKRRADAEAAKDTREAPLSDVARAARLGRIPVATYEARLVRAGYSPDDVALEVDLLVYELAETAAARKRRDEAELAARNRGLSLQDTARAVRGGRLTIDAYTAAVKAAGFTEDAARILTRLLVDEIAEREAADARRDEIGAAGDARRLSLSQLAGAVKARLRSIEDYYLAIRELGYADEDAAVLTSLLERELALVQAAETRDDEIERDAPEAHATLGQLGQAVKDGLITMADYVGELRARGYGEAPLLTIDRDGRAVLDEASDGPYDDTELLALLLQVQLDAAATKGAK